jgi:hypothetical protein
MLAFKLSLIALALLPSVFAAPLHNHHRRSGKCTHRPSSTQNVAAVKPASTSSKHASSATSTKTSSSVKETESGSSSSGTTKAPGALAALFPVGQTKQLWSTSSLVDGAIALTEKTLRPVSVMSGLPNEFTKGPDGKNAIKVTYKKGSYRYIGKNGGISIYARGPADVDLTTAKEATFGYSVYFEKGFEFNKGGKLFGLYGGNSDDDAQGCSGGSRSDKCFSARFMFRPDGAGELYTYLPPSVSANDKVCKQVAHSTCNPTYGASVGTGSFKFATGAWTQVSQRVRLNDVGKSNGEVEIFANGKSLFTVDNLQLRTSDSGRIRGQMLQSFFGGSSSEWASPKTQDAYFADFSVAITEKL